MKKSFGLLPSGCRSRSTCLPGYLLFLLAVIQVFHDLLHVSLAHNTSFRLLHPEYLSFCIHPVSLGVKDDSRWEGISQVANGVGPVEVDIADIDVEGGRVLVVVAEDVDEVDLHTVVVALLEEPVLF